MTREEAIAYFIDSNERIVSAAKDENRYNYETQQIEDAFIRRSFEANKMAIKALDQESCDVNSEVIDAVIEWLKDKDIIKTNYQEKRARGELIDYMGKDWKARDKMTLDEAIKRYTSNAFYEKSDGNLQGCLEFEQLAEWLKDYKRLLEQKSCEDCISRQAIDEVKELMTDINGNTVYAVKMSDIRQLPSVNPQEPKAEWISVSEELPEEEGDYLLWGKVYAGEKKEYSFIGEYDSEYEQFGYWQEQFDSSTLGCLGSDFFEYGKVVAWMPLPEPYKEG